jgi:hypothetical protein
MVPQAGLGRADALPKRISHPRLFIALEPKFSHSRASACDRPRYSTHGRRVISLPCSECVALVQGGRQLRYVTPPTS